MVFLLALWVSAISPEVQQTLDDAEEHYTRAEFGKAISLLDGLLQKAIDDETRAKVHFRIGANWVALGNTQRASEAFKAVLDLDYEFPLPTLVPRSLRTAFEAARADYVVRPTLSHKPPSRIDPRMGADLVFSTTRRIPKAYESTLNYRLRGAPTYRPLALVSEDGRTLTGNVGASELTQGSAIEYFVEISAPKHGKVAALRSEKDPYAVQLVVPDQSKPVTQKWWFWTLIGGVALAAAGGITAGVLLSQPADPAVGNARVSVVFP